MKKFAQSVSEDLYLLESTVGKLYDTIHMAIDRLGMLKDDPQLEKLCDKVFDAFDSLDTYILNMQSTLEDYEKPSMDTEDVLDVVEERY